MDQSIRKPSSNGSISKNRNFAEMKPGVQMTPEQIATVRKIAKAIIEAVHEVGEAPAGAIYAALQSQGASENQFNSLMAGAVKGGLLTHCQESHTYQTTEKGLKFAGLTQ